MKKIAISVILAGCSLALLGGCSGTSNKESLLLAAGFRERTPQTDKQKKIYASLPDEKIQRATVNGKVFYAYKDEDKGVAYVGGENEYQRYHQLATEQRIARENYEAAEMNREMAWGWYGAWGPRSFWW